MKYSFFFCSRIRRPSVFRYNSSYMPVVSNKVYSTCIRCPKRDNKCWELGKLHKIILTACDGAIPLIREKPL